MSTKEPSTLQGGEDVRWKYLYDVNKFVREGTPENAKEIATKIFGFIYGKPGFEECDSVDKLKDVETVEDFDEAWEEIYDYADENRIWLGI